MTYILEKEYGLSDLKLCHRLDRVTSGCLIFAKNGKAATNFIDKLKFGDVRKYYLAEVDGKFKEEVVYVDNYLYVSNAQLGKWSFVKDKEHLKELEKKLISSELKSAFTLYKRIGYNEKTDSSLIFCAPLTGRTHQLREHFKSLGFNIINDVYSEIPGRKDNHWETLFDENGFFIGDVDPIKENPNPDKKRMVIHLHAAKYESEQYCFETKTFPEWTNEFKDVYNLSVEAQKEINQYIKDNEIRVDKEML